MVSTKREHDRDNRIDGLAEPKYSLQRSLCKRRAVVVVSVRRLMSHPLDVSQLLVQDAGPSVPRGP